MPLLRKCKHCGLEAHCENDLELFTKSKKSTHGRSNQCKECTNKLHRTNYSFSKNSYQLKIRYKCTPEEYQEAMSTSDCCEVCGSKDKNLCYDHDHNTMKFRGVLCTSCNYAIGILGDNLEGVKNAYNYLRRHYK